MNAIILALLLSQTTDKVITVHADGVVAPNQVLKTLTVCAAGEAMFWSGAAFSCVPLTGGTTPPTCANGSASSYNGAAFVCLGMEPVAPLFYDGPIIAKREKAKPFPPQQKCNAVQRINCIKG